MSLGSRRGLVLAVVLFVILSVAWRARHIVDGGWRGALGYEFEWIAEPLSKGYGYTFAYDGRWLGPYDNPLTPTAWVEPVQTGVMALAFRALGEQGRMPLVLLNYLWFAACCLLVFEIGRRVSSLSGGTVAAIALAALSPGKNELRWYIGNSALAAVLICGVALGLLMTFERASLRRSAILGLLLGVLALTHAGTMLFVPFAALIAVVAVRDDSAARRLAHGAIVLLTAAAVVLPWSIRNYQAFGEVVPVRTGLGQNMHYALPALAQTIQPDIALGDGWPPPPWTAANARDAMSRILITTSWRELKNHSIAAGRAGGPADYSLLNEAQRDAILREQSIDFIRNYPGFAIRLGIAKADGFFWSNWPDFRPVTVLAIIGALITLRRRSGWIIGGLIVLYVVPYLLSAPIYYRYRAPIEPLLFVLCGVPVGLCFDAIRARRESGRRPRRGTSPAAPTSVV